MKIVNKLNVDWMNKGIITHGSSKYVIYQLVIHSYGDVHTYIYRLVWEFDLYVIEWILYSILYWINSEAGCRGALNHEEISNQTVFDIIFSN